MAPPEADPPLANEVEVSGLGVSPLFATSSEKVVLSIEMLESSWLAIPPPNAEPDSGNSVGCESLGLAPAPPFAWLLETIPPTSVTVELLETAIPPPNP